MEYLVLKSHLKKWDLLHKRFYSYQQGMELKKKKKIKLKTFKKVN